MARDTVRAVTTEGSGESVSLCLKRAQALRAVKRCAQCNNSPPFLAEFVSLLTSQQLIDLRRLVRRPSRVSWRG